ncbi:hypothetical protein P4K96_27595 [Bacillus cereus]|uniref:hypothetical protein n=1 Tax=Paenibacillus melissococcoides TaxID=2912268 RepID=UPI0021C44AE3|nr:hypothetical protein [Paenibacillus melissococcoides]MEB9897184.1 hypothetical protein [Bacillus cereus]CAH8721277.1 hypothetical protein HTL2_006278 [Paenibacillus melissococcoides]
MTNDNEVLSVEIGHAMSCEEKSKTQHLLYLGTLGEGRELKTVKSWCEKEFGITVPESLINDSQLYTHKEVWQLLDRNGVR